MVFKTHGCTSGLSINVAVRLHYGTVAMKCYRVTARKDQWGEVESYDGKPDGFAIHAGSIKKKQVTG